MRVHDEINDELLDVAEQHGGAISPAMVVDRARAKGNVLHPLFEWDNKVAGERYRLQQASRILRVRIESVHPDDGGQVIKIRRFVSLSGERGNGASYHRTVTVLSDKELRKQMLADALLELESFQRKYARLEELSEVFQAIRAVRQGTHSVA